MLRILLLVAAAALLALDGLLHGLWTERWYAWPSLEAALPRLDRVRLAIGDWRGEPGPPLDQREVEQAGFRAHFVRRYENRRTGESVSVVLGCGRPGPLALHTPDVCYRGVGFEPSGPVVTHLHEAAPTALAQFHKLTLTKLDAAGPARLRILWSWNARGTWQAPDNPRLTFAGASALHKLYVIYEMRGDEHQADEVCDQFLRQLLPELEQALSPDS